ncbi:MAG: S1C family serine protease, partial [Candidatus Binatia bacterium]
AGHWLIGVGNPAGPAVAFDVGVVSATAQRECYQELRSATMVQSSLPIPAASLGGPVVDIHGDVMGISVRLPSVPATAQAPAQPESAAILPVNLLLNLHEALRAARSERSPWLGISVLELSLYRNQVRDNAIAAKMPDAGVYIDNVFEPSPATRAGVRRGDFLLAVNGSAVTTVGDFQHQLYTSGIGSRAELGLLRDGQPLTVSVVVEERPEEARMR